MTIILAAREADGVWLGVDSRSANSYGNYSDNFSKAVRVQNFIIGCSGSCRVSQLIAYNQDRFDPIKKDKHVFRFAHALQQLMVEDHKANVGYERKETFTAMIAAPSGVYCLYKNFQFVKHESWACGSGEDFGLGFYRALGLEDTELRIKTAIEATAQYINSVGGPVTVLRVGEADGT